MSTCLSLLDDELCVVTYFSLAYFQLIFCALEASGRVVGHSPVGFDGGLSI